MGRPEKRFFRNHLEPPGGHARDFGDDGDVRRHSLDHPEDAVIGLSHGAPSAYSDLAAIVRFSPTGTSSSGVGERCLEVDRLG
jgi:hypothetical protein